MNRSINLHDYDNDDPDYEVFEPLRGARRNARRRPRPGTPAPADEGEAPSESNFNPTFSSSKHERRWIRQYLGPFYDDHLITDVLRQVRGGKEATVYCCRAHPSTGEELLAAKVYRPREFRALRNDAPYREGRMVINEAGKEVRDQRALHAVRNKTKVGLEILNATWLGHEFGMLARLHEAGVAVPRPVAQESNAILMTYVGDDEMAAPTLSQVSLARDEAEVLFVALLDDVETLLRCGCIHGDLSAFNILYWKGRGVLIDFPQAVDPFKNPQAWPIFRRDLERLCQYFARQGVRRDAERLARGIWARQVHERHRGIWVEPVPEPRRGRTDR